MAEGREGAREILPRRFARALHAAAAGADHQKSVEGRTGLSTTQGGARAGSLRRPQLDGLASSRDIGNVGARFPDIGKAAQQKKLLGGPCHRRAVKSSA